jgi:hypothetical protein
MMLPHKQSTENHFITSNTTHHTMWTNTSTPDNRHNYSQTVRHASHDHTDHGNPTHAEGVAGRHGGRRGYRPRSNPRLPGRLHQSNHLQAHPHTPTTMTTTASHGATQLTTTDKACALQVPRERETLWKKKKMKRQHRNIHASQAHGILFTPSSECLPFLLSPRANGRQCRTTVERGARRIHTANNRQGIGKFRNVCCRFNLSSISSTDLQGWM